MSERYPDITTEELTPFQNAVAVDTSAFDTLVSG